MIKQLLSLCFLAACLSLWSCDDENRTITPAPTPPDADRVNFQQPAVGQFNEYEVLSYTCGEAYHADRPSLRLAITAVSETEIEFTETLGDQEPVVFRAERRPGNLLISAEDRRATELFFFYGSDSIRLDAPPTATLTQKDCVFFDGASKFTGNYVARVPSFQIDGRTLTELKTVSCVPTILDLDGYLLYDEHTLKASISATTSEFGGNEDRLVRTFVLREGTD